MTVELWNPRCCAVIGLGDGPARRYLLELGAYHPEMVAELRGEAVRALAAELEALPQDPGGLLPRRVPTERVTMRLSAVVVAAGPDSVVLTGWCAGTTDDAGPDLRVVLTARVAAALGRSCRAALLPRAVLCPFCGLALEPDGHVCPRANGYRR